MNRKQILEKVANKWHGTPSIKGGYNFSIPGEEFSGEDGRDEELCHKLHIFVADDGKFAIVGLTQHWADAEGEGCTLLIEEYPTSVEDINPQFLWDLEKTRENWLRINGVQFKVVDEIDCLVQDGGNICNHRTSPGTDYYFWSDSFDDQQEEVEAPRYCEKHSNRYHIGCQETPATIRIKGGTFVVEGQESGGRELGDRKVFRVTMTQKANTEELWRNVEELLKHSSHYPVPYPS